MMSDEYPTEDTLQRLREWPIEKAADGLDFLAAQWRWPDYVRHDLKPAERELVRAENGERFLRLATGGWSGNESLISAFDRSLASLLTWRLSASGGLHIYRYPTLRPAAARDRRKKVGERRTPC